MDSDASFDASFGDLFSRGYQAAYRVLGDSAAAQDAALEALARAWVNWSSIEPYCRPWVVRVSARLALDELRRRSFRRRIPAPADHHDSDASELRLDLQRHLLALPRRQREVAVMRYLADLSETDVAASLGCSEGSVKRHSHRALEALRRSHETAAMAAEDER